MAEKPPEPSKEERAGEEAKKPQLPRPPEPLSKRQKTHDKKQDGWTNNWTQNKTENKWEPGLWADRGDNSWDSWEHADHEESHSNWKGGENRHNDEELERPGARRSYGRDNEKILQKLQASINTYQTTMKTNFETLTNSTTTLNRDLTSKMNDLENSFKSLVNAVTANVGDQVYYQLLEKEHQLLEKLTTTSYIHGTANYNSKTVGIAYDESYDEYENCMTSRMTDELYKTA